MTEEEWKLRKENASLKKLIAQLQFNTADAEDKALGEAYVPDEPPKTDAPPA